MILCLRKEAALVFEKVTDAEKSLMNINFSKLDRSI